MLFFATSNCLIQRCILTSSLKTSSRTQWHLNFDEDKSVAKNYVIFLFLKWKWIISKELLILSFETKSYVYPMDRNVEETDFFSKWRKVWPHLYLISTHEFNIFHYISELTIANFCKTSRWGRIVCPCFSSIYQ